MGSGRSGSRGFGAARVQELLEDLDALVDGPRLTLQLGRDGGRVSVGSGKTPLYLRTGGRGWRRINRRARREILLAWIQGAACVTRGRLLIGRAVR